VRAVAAVLALLVASGSGAGELTVDGTRFRLGGQPFDYTGVSFFNAIYNAEFNRSSEARGRWLDDFRAHGINALRIWAQWDNPRGFVDSCAECSLFRPDGSLRTEGVHTLCGILADADARGMVVELALFARESWDEGIRLDEKAAEAAVAALSRELLPHRNVALQIWNEHSWHTVPLLRVIKRVDPRRLVTNSPGYAGVLEGAPGENAALDYLTPHTSRQSAGRTWEVAPAEIRYLLARYRKPVVDDEPARNGTSSFGGPRERTDPLDHVFHVWEVRKAGGHPTYHHDMFQMGRGHPSVPPSGIPEPDFSPYHAVVFDFLGSLSRYRVPPAGH
jgi:hypothetical protein